MDIDRAEEAFRYFVVSDVEVQFEDELISFVNAHDQFPGSWNADEWQDALNKLEKLAEKRQNELDEIRDRESGTEMMNPLEHHRQLNEIMQWHTYKNHG